MKNLFLALCFFTSIISTAQESPIIPQPASLKMGNGNFVVNNKTNIVTKGSGLDKSAKFLQAYLKKPSYHPYCPHYKPYSI